MIIPLEVLDTAEYRTRLLVTDSSPLPNAKFVLDSASVAGLLGGEEAMSTVALAQVYDRRKWLGWYNTPGSYIIGKRFRRLAHSIVPDSHVNPGSGTESERVHIDPALLLQHDGWSQGPVFKGIYSGTSLHETGPLASLLMKECIKMPGTLVKGRETQSVNVTIAKLKPDLQPQAKFPLSSPTCAVIPIVVSLATCAICGLYGEWYAFFMILLGILARGLTCVFIGSGKLDFHHPKPADGSPPGDGILGCDHELVLLKGHENVVNAVTRGRFLYSFESKHACQMVELCSFFLIVQAIAQLICVPQSDLFGQLMFVVSIATSWMYNLWFLSLDKVKVRKEIFHSVLRSLELEKFVFPNRSTAVVSLLLWVNGQAHSGDPEKLRKIMDGLLPSGSLVWETWKETVIERLTKKHPPHSDDTHRNPVDLPSNAEGGNPNTPSEPSVVSSNAEGGNPNAPSETSRVSSNAECGNPNTPPETSRASSMTKLTGAEAALLQSLLADAETAFTTFRSNE